MHRTQASSTPAIPPITHSEALELSRAAYDRFATLVESLDADAWTRPTDCEDWTVRDLVGHMVGAMRSAASVRELVSQFREIKALQRARGGNQTDAMTEVQVRRTAGLPVPALVAECRALVEPAARGRHRVPAPLRLVTFPVDIGLGGESRVERWSLGYLNDVILTRDAWLHAVDLARATGAALVPDTELDRRVVADVVAEWARRHGRAFDLELTGPAGGGYTGGAGPAKRIRIDAVEFCRTLSGRSAGTGLLATTVPF